MEQRGKKVTQEKKIYRKPENQNQMKIGLDVGGCLFQHDGQENGGREDTSGTQWMPGALEAVAAMAEKDSHTLYVVSFAGKKRGLETVAAFDAHPDFGKWVPPGRVYVVNDRKKKVNVINEHSIEVMVDDRLDILEDVLARSPGIRLCVLYASSRMNEEEVKKAVTKYTGKRLVVANSWKEVREAILKME
jgi:hypothetical protein